MSFTMRLRPFSGTPKVTVPSVGVDGVSQPRKCRDHASRFTGVSPEFSPDFEPYIPPAMSENAPTPELT